MVAEVAVAVFTLFRPTGLSVTPLERPMRTGTAVLAAGKTHAISATMRADRAGEFVLAVPGRIERRFRGRLHVLERQGVLTPVVVMPLEEAVAAIVAAELPLDSPPEAAKALAVAARSYLTAARPRHKRFDFCDTTHCQFLRQPARPATEAAAATKSIVVTFAGRPFAAAYSASCGGRTRSGPAPYEAVDCGACLRDGPKWRRRLPLAEAAPLMKSPSERMRLGIVRKLGWDALPSNNYRVWTDQGEAVFEGRGRGHGFGLCQHGAIAMARAGASFRDILRAYLPHARLEHAAGE